MALADLIKDYGPSVPWALAVAGLLYNNRTANHREKRKEFRAEIDSLEKVVKELSGKLTTYFRLSEHTADTKRSEAEIKVLFKELDFKWERLSKRQSGGTLGLLIDPCSQALESLFDQATGKYFESTDLIPPAEVDSHVSDLQIRSLIFVEALHSLFLKKFDGI
jgi:hypothetical protein